MPVLASVLLFACGEAASSSGDAGPEDAAAGDAAMAQDGATPTCPIEDPPTPASAVASVRFDLTGPAGTWIADRGTNCQPMWIADVQLTEPSVVHCEGPAPENPTVARAVPAETGVSFPWDGQSLVGYVSSCVDCADRGFPGQGLSPERTWVARGVSAGSYSAVFVVLDAVPSNCTEGADGVLDCAGSGFGSGGDGTSICPGRTVTVDFELPASGELVVPVDVTPTAP